jgi:DNA-binding transcriptional regulator YhcF (GntR family)
VRGFNILFALFDFSFVLYGGVAVSDTTSPDMNASRHIHRRDHIYSLDRGKRYTVLLRRLFFWLDGEELMALGYLLSLANREHPSINDMATDLSMSARVVKRTLESLRSKRILFQDFVKMGSRRKSLWHISHPCRWEGSDVSLVDSIDPSTHEPRTCYDAIPRINEAREYILSQPDTIRVPNVLFRVHMGWRARYLWAWLSQLPDDVNPTITQLAHRLDFNWRTIREALDMLDDAGMIVIEEHHRRRFGGWACLYFHLTDLHDWKYEAARETYEAPRKRPLRVVGRYSAEEGWHDRRASFEPQYQSIGINSSSGISAPSNCSAFESQRLHFSSAESDRALYFDSAFSHGTSALRPQMSSFQTCRTAQNAIQTPVKPFSSNGSGSYNKAFIIKAIEESREEGITRACEARDARVTMMSEGREKPVPLSRIISIADSVTHAFVNSRNKKCDPALWTDAVVDVYKSEGESGARRFARFVSEVFMARGRRPIAYNSLAVEDLATAFLSGKSPTELTGSDNWAVAMQEGMLESEGLAQARHSNGMPSMVAEAMEASALKGPVFSIEAGAVSEAQKGGSEPNAKPGRLRDLPEDENRQRWLIHRMWPKLIKSQKAALQAIWSGSPDPEAAILGFAARDEDSHMKVISAAAELLGAGILPEVPPMPWDAEPPSRIQKPNLRAGSDEKAGVEAPKVARENPSPLIPEFTRARLDLAVPTLTKEYKAATRLSMEKGFSRLGDADLWRSLCGTFTEARVREVLSAIS